MVLSANTHCFNKPSVSTIFNWLPTMTGLFPSFHTGSRWNRHSTIGSGRINPDRLVLSWRARDGAHPRPQPWRCTARPFGPKKAVRWELTGKIRRLGGCWLSSKELHRRVLSRGRGEFHSGILLPFWLWDQRVVDKRVSESYFLREIEHSKGLRWN